MRTAIAAIWPRDDQQASAPFAQLADVQERAELQVAACRGAFQSVDDDGRADPVGVGVRGELPAGEGLASGGGPVVDEQNSVSGMEDRGADASSRWRSR